MGRARIAGILDCHGGLRVVCGTEQSIYANCSLMFPDKLFLLPKYCWVELDKNGQIPWNMLGWTVRRVELFIVEWARRNHNHPDIEHIAVKRYLPRYALKKPDGTGGDGALHIAGLLEPPS